MVGSRVSLREQSLMHDCSATGVVTEVIQGCLVRVAWDDGGESWHDRSFVLSFIEEVVIQPWPER